MDQNVSSPGTVSQVVEHLFRHEAGKMIATLTRIFGLEHLTLAENVIQATLARALQTRPFCGVPKNPARWTSRVRAMDGRVRNCIVCGYNEECVGGCRI